MITGVPGARITLKDVGVSCPQCGQMTKVPDGTYEFYEEAIKALSGVRLGRQQLRRAARKVEKLSDPDAIVSALGTIDPTLGELAAKARSAPNSRTRFWVILAAAGTAFATWSAGINSVVDTAIKIQGMRGGGIESSEANNQPEGLMQADKDAESRPKRAPTKDTPQKHREPDR